MGAIEVLELLLSVLGLYLQGFWLERNETQIYIDAVTMVTLKEITDDECGHDILLSDFSHTLMLHVEANIQILFSCSCDCSCVWNSQELFIRLDYRVGICALRQSRQRGQQIS